jgi:hypothetical protein
MKRIITIYFILLVQIAFGQDSTRFLISSKSLKVKFFGGTGIESSFVNQKVIFSSSVDLGLIFNKKVFIGIYSANGLNSTSRIIVDNASSKEEFRFYQAGLKAGYIFKPHKAIHLVASSKVGVLTADYQNINGLFEEFKDDVYVLPQLEAQLNLTRYFRLGLGAGYRFTNRKDVFFQQNQANSMVYHIDLCLGRFYR